MTLVLDAALGVELVLETPLGSRTLPLVSAHDVLVPELFDLEVASALARMERGAAIEAETARAAMTNLDTLPVERVASRPLVADAWRHRHNLSIYDALYVALAERRGCPLVTADARLAGAPGLGVPVTVVS